MDDGIVGCSVALGDFDVETKVGVILDGCWDASATGKGVGSDDTVDGWKLGLLIGTVDGWKLGLLIGTVDGWKLGLLIGTVVGWILGLFIGTVVGWILGLFIGTVVGWILGLLIGDSVSPIADGDKEGFKFGILDGADVKAAIGLLLLGVSLGEA
eukprot:gene31875-biopygen20497